MTGRLIGDRYSLGSGMDVCAMAETVTQKALAVIPGMERLPQNQPSLAGGVPDAQPGTIYVLSVEGGVRADPGTHRTILFGRNREEVHVSIGEDDQRVSRMHGSISYRGNQWQVAVTGRLPVRFPGELMLFAGEDPLPLTAGYTPLFVQGSSGREHLLQVYVVGDSGSRP